MSWSGLQSFIGNCWGRDKCYVCVRRINLKIWPWKVCVPGPQDKIKGLLWIIRVGSLGLTAAQDGASGWDCWWALVCWLGAYSSWWWPTGSAPEKSCRAEFQAVFYSPWLQLFSHGCRGMLGGGGEAWEKQFLSQLRLRGVKLAMSE